MTITELETLFRRVDEIRMSAAERELAKARLAQGDAVARFFLSVATGLRRLMRAGSAPARRNSGLNARVSS
jgi:hypothetical protein